MKLLLDTHAFIWWDSAPQRLSPSALAAMSDPSNELWLSVVSVWEMIIKEQLGKLVLHLPVDEIVTQQQSNGVQTLEVNLAHTWALIGLPQKHKDPFDRLLIAQAIVEGATFVTADAAIGAYNIPVLW